MKRFELTVLAACALALAGCSGGTGSTQNKGDGGALQQSDGGSDGGTSDGGTDAGTAQLTGISVAPENATLDVYGSTPTNQLYTVTAHYDDGHTADVSNASGFTLGDVTLGHFSGRTFITNIAKGGTTQITASYQGQTVGTAVTLVDHQTFTTGSGFPSDPNAPFTGPADASKAPNLVYPNDGVLLPPNLGRLEIHFIPKNASELFQLSFENAYTDVKVNLTSDTQLNGGCIYQPDPNVWSAIAKGNRGKGALTVAIKEADAAGTGVGTSNAITISFSHDDLNGGLYYWTTSKFSDGVSTAIMRYDFGGVQTSASRFLTTQATLKPDGGSNGANCLGCHALSPDGTKVVAEVNGQNDGRILMYDVTNSAPLVDFPAADSSIFESWSPDGSQFVGVDMDKGFYPLRIHDGTTGALLYSIPGTGDATNPADHPDWSHDGQKIVYMKAGVKGTCQRSFEGALEMVTRQADGGWSAPAELLARTTHVNHYYPAFAPDDSFIVYDQSTCLGDGGTGDSSCNGDTDPTASVWVLPLDGGSPIALANANKPGLLDRLADGGVQTMLTDSFPKWSPFVNQRTTDPADKVMWLTFASSRNFGLRTPVAGSGEAQLGRGTLLWMVAIDPAKLAAGQDPSYPAFALPFQDLNTSNHIPQWTQTVVQGVCTDYGGACDPQIGNCCSGLTCQGDNADPPHYTCLPPVQACGATGSSCDPAANTCCTGLSCQSNMADPPVTTCEPIIN